MIAQEIRKAGAAIKTSVSLAWPQKCVLSVLAIPGDAREIRRRSEAAAGPGANVGSVIMALEARGMIQGSAGSHGAVVWARTQSGDDALWTPP